MKFPNLFAYFVAAVLGTPVFAVGAPLYQNTAANTELRVGDLMSRMTVAEKLDILAFEGHHDNLKLILHAVPRLGIPPFRTSDAPQGLRDGPSTAFPMGVVMASTWNPRLISLVGSAIGQEARIKNRELVYGPCVNIQRTPMGGRYFECFSEDPFLSAQITVSYIKGMQGEGVAACVKHFLCDNEETNRTINNVHVGERAMHEIYLPSFEAAVQRGHVWAMMAALNEVNDEYVAQSKSLITDLVKDKWHWDGVLISDWGAIHDSVAAVNAGTDIEMPDPVYFAPGTLTDELDKGQISQTIIDDKVRRILRLMIRTGLLDGKPQSTAPLVNTPQHQALALKVAQEGMVLLKNATGVLPLDKSRVKSIAVIGPNAQDTQLGGRSSAYAPAFYMTNVLQGIEAKCPGATVTFAQGCPRTGASDSAVMATAVAAAAKAEIAVVVVGTDANWQGEGLDPPSLNLPGDQEKLIQAVSAVNNKTIVVLNNGSPVVMTDWVAKVPAVLEAWYAGEETGNAVADILFGSVNPSGKLTGTQAFERADYPGASTFASVNNVLDYKEGIYVGYRYFDKNHIAPRFPFGFGLSYTTFQYDKFVVPATVKSGLPFAVNLRVRNTGRRAGDEIVEVYVHDLSPKIDRPMRELKGFARVSLAPGQAAIVRIRLGSQSFSYWNVHTHAWTSNPGNYEIEAGSSSRDLRVKSTLRLL